MKQENFDTNNYQGNQSCAATGLKLSALVIVIIWFCVTIWGCKTQEPCGDYDKWEAKTKFRSK